MVISGYPTEMAAIMFSQTEEVAWASFVYKMLYLRLDEN